MPTYPQDGASGEFEWPPREDVLERQVLWLDNSSQPRGGLEDFPDEPAPPVRHAAPTAPAARPRPSLLDEPRTAVPRISAKQGRAQPDPEQKRPRSWYKRLSVPGRPSGRSLSLAAVLVTLIAALPAAYLLRSRPSPVAIPASQPIAAPGVEAPRPPAVPAAGPQTTAAGTSGRAARRVPPVSTTGRLVVKSEPSGVKVTIDGRDRGVTPLTLANLKPGEYDVLLHRDGQEVRQNVRIKAGATVSMIAPLPPGPPAPGWLAVDSPVALDVFEEGSLLGTSRSSQILLQAGEHALLLVNDELNFRETRRVRIDSDQVTRVPVELPRAIVQVNALPWAEVFVDGNHVGQTPIGRLALTLGTHQVVFRHPVFGEKTTEAVVRAGTPTRVAIDLRPQPTIPK